MTLYDCFSVSLLCCVSTIDFVNMCDSTTGAPTVILMSSLRGLADQCDESDKMDQSNRISPDGVCRCLHLGVNARTLPNFVFRTLLLLYGKVKLHNGQEKGQQPDKASKKRR